MEKISPIDAAIDAGRNVLIAFTITCVFIEGIVEAPSLTSMFMTGPLTMITGRKNISLKKALHFILPFNIIAMISANTTITGTSTIVCQIYVTSCFGNSGFSSHIWVKFPVPTQVNLVASGVILMLNHM